MNDHVQDRQYLAALFRYQGYAVLEAADALAALQLLERHAPHLIISAARVPPVGGFEFVRRVRASARTAGIPVVFYTHLAHARETRAVADLCGVEDILTRTAAPEMIVDRIHALVSRARARDLQSDAHAPRPVESMAEPSAQLIDMVQELAAAEQQMTAVAALCQQLTRERAPLALLPSIVEAIVTVTGAEYAVAGWLAPEGHETGDRAAVGADGDTLSALRDAPLADGLRASMLQRVVVRWESARQAVTAFDRPLPELRIRNGLAVPLATPSGVHGWVVALNRQRGLEFTDRDEQAAAIIGGQAGIAYENARLIAELQARGEQLHTTNVHTTFALEAAQTGVWSWDLPGGPWHDSPSLRAVLQLNDGDGIRSLDELLAVVVPDDRVAVDQAFRGCVESLSGLDVEFHVLRSDQSVRVMHALGRVSIDRSGTAARMHGVLTDVTERRLLEAQLRQAQRIETVGLLAGGIAHDFNNMLTAILGYARLAQDQVAQQVSPLAEIQQIHRAAERASVLTRQLLTFSRQQVIEPMTLDLNAVIEDLAGMLRRLIGDHIHVALSLERTLAPIRADRSQVEQVIMNLVVNARDAMPAGGRVELRTFNATLTTAHRFRGTTAVPGAYAGLSISDTGTGIPETVQARIFDPFFTTKERGRGTGLGLATVYGVLRQNGGYVDVESETGKGTTFTTYFPTALDLPTDTIVTTPARRARGRAEQVLVVEDEPEVRRLVRTVLERAGYRVTEAANAQEAERALAASGTDVQLLLTDIVMPGVTGAELYQQLSRAHPALRVVFMSGYADDQAVADAVTRPGTLFLQKPFTIEALVRRVREALDR